MIESCIVSALRPRLVTKIFVKKIHVALFVVIW
jgi:hypothetical protein